MSTFYTDGYRDYPKFSPPGAHRGSNVYAQEYERGYRRACIDVAMASMGKRKARIWDQARRALDYGETDRADRMFALVKRANQRIGRLRETQYAHC